MGIDSYRSAMADGVPLCSHGVRQKVGSQILKNPKFLNLKKVINLHN
jgi:hypothetical protein